MMRLFLLYKFTTTILLLRTHSGGAAAADNNGKLPITNTNNNDRPEPSGSLRHGDDTDASDPAGNVAVYTVFPSKTRGCSGMMANSEWVVTAAHCLKGLQPGDPVSLYYTSSDGAKFRTNSTTIAEKFMHPRYDPDLSVLFFFGRKAGFDFGMFRLAEPTITCKGGFDCSWSDPDQPMNAVFAYSESAIFVRREFLSTGYGLTTETGSDYSTVLRKGLVRAFSSVSLSGGSIWRQMWRPRIFGNDPARACAGDSGSPLLMQTEDSPLTGFSVVGVLSGGTICDSMFGVKFYHRLTEETADMIDTHVVSSGGSCEKFVGSGGSKLMRCRG